MDSLITNGVDPALMRVLERRGQEKDAQRPPKRALASEKFEETADDEQEQRAQDGEATKHELDDLA